MAAKNKKTDLDNIHFDTPKDKKYKVLPDTQFEDDDEIATDNTPFSKETAAILGFMPTDEDFN